MLKLLPFRLSWKWFRNRDATTAASLLATDALLLFRTPNELEKLPVSELRKAFVSNGAFQLPWTLDTGAVIVTDLAATELRLNDAAVADATELYLHETANASIAASGFLNTIVKGSRLFLSKSSGDGSAYAIFSVTSNTDNGSTRTLVVTYVTGGGTFADGDTVNVAVAGPLIPAKPADNVTATLKCVNGTLTWVTDA